MAQEAAPRPIDQVIREAKAGPQEAATLKTLAALRVGDAEAADAALAVSLSRTLDSMDQDARARTGAQVGGQLLRILDRLRQRGRALRRAEF